MQILENVPSFIREPTLFKDQKTTDSFSFKNNLLLNFPDEVNFFTVNYKAVNYRAFADAAFPKLIAQSMYVY